MTTLGSGASTRSALNGWACLMRTFPLPLNPFSRLLFMEAARALNRKASAKFARRQAYLGRPVPRSDTDRRPDPGTLDDGDDELG